VLCQGGERHGRQADEEPHAEDTVPAFPAVAEIADRVDGADHEQHTGDQQDQLADRVEEDPAGVGGRRGVHQYGGGQGEVEGAADGQHDRAPVIVR